MPQVYGACGCVIVFFGEFSLVMPIMPYRFCCFNETFCGGGEKIFSLCFEVYHYKRGQATSEVFTVSSSFNSKLVLTKPEIFSYLLENLACIQVNSVNAVYCDTEESVYILNCYETVAQPDPCGAGIRLLVHPYLSA